MIKGNIPSKRFTLDLIITVHSFWNFLFSMTLNNLVSFCNIFILNSDFVTKVEVEIVNVKVMTNNVRLS